VTAQLYFVRHGETTWSLSGRHTGRTDIALTPHGEDEARRLRPLLERVTFSAVFASPRQRALQTCELAGLAATAEIEPDLAEWDYGDYEGRRSVDIIKERPGWNVFRDGCPHGETPEHIAARADRLIARLCGLEGSIALFSHGQFGCALAARWIDLPVADGEHFSLGPASLGTLGFSPSHPDVRVIAHWNIVPQPSDAPITAVDASSPKVDHFRSPAGAV
jgi:broad specificity phosphatase PhoE